MPEEVSLIGFDDLPEAQFFAPPLTTVHQDFAEVGRRAMALVIDELDGVTAVRREFIVPKLVVRQSTAPVAGVTQ